MEKKSITSFLSINSHIFPRLSFMAGGGKKFECKCPTDDERNADGKLCVCTEETTEQSENIDTSPSVSDSSHANLSSTSSGTIASTTIQTATNALSNINVPSSTITTTNTNQNPNTNTDDTTTRQTTQNLNIPEDNYDTYTEPQTETESEA